MNRRTILCAGAAALVLPQRAFAQHSDTIRLPQGLARGLDSLLPDEFGDAVRVVEQVTAMEGRARVLRLPPSRLAVDALPLSPDIGDALYRFVLPRLVALIDRADRRNAPLANEAAALLSQLNGAEHAPSAGWSGTALSFDGEDAADALPLPDQADLPVVEPVVGPVVEPEPAQPLRATRFDLLADEYRRYWDQMAVDPARADTVDWHVRMLAQSRPRYEAAARRVDVPWYFIGAIHALEASFNFRAHLHNGDYPLSQRTRQVPQGRPLRWLPPSEWEASAEDAMRMMGFAGQSDWSLERTLYRLEAHNGFGYRSRRVPTPYLWSFSQHYQTGKFVADGRWNPRARSQQCGSAVMLKALEAAGEISLSVP